MTIIKTFCVLDQVAVERIYALDRPGEVRGGFLKELLEVFDEFAPAIIKEIHEARGQSDFKRLEYLAHKLRGVSRNVAVVELASSCELIEDAAGRQVMSDPSVFDQLDRQFQDGRSALVQLLDAKPTSKYKVDRTPTRQRVLIVEDNQINQILASRILEKMGLTFDVVANGKEAVDAVRNRGPYDAVLMDCQMPEMDGFDATKAIRTFASTPIIAMTASRFDQSKDACLAAGMNDFVSKPLHLGELERVFKALAKSA